MSWFAYDTFVSDNCDYKFGCVGGFQLALFLYGICAFITACLFSFSYYLIYIKDIQSPSKRNLIITIIISALLGFTSPLYLSNAIGEEIGMVIGWVFISFIVSFTCYLLEKNITRHCS